MRYVIASLVLLLLLAGCGVGVQDRPEPINIPDPPTTDPGPTTDSGGRDVTVFFVRGARLEPAVRSTARPGVGSVLERLVAGPSRSEVIDGLRTALAPQILLPEPTGSTRPVVTIAVSREFTDVAGGNQLLAVAQVVWTATQVPGIDLVRVTADGQPVEIPTDEGLTDQPVGRSDYRSVAPRGEELPSAPGTASTPEQTPPRGGDTVPPALPSSGATPTTQRRGPLPRRRRLVCPSDDTPDRSGDGPLTSRAALPLKDDERAENHQDRRGRTWFAPPRPHGWWTRPAPPLHGPEVIAVRSDAPQAATYPAGPGTR